LPASTLPKASEALEHALADPTLTSLRAELERLGQ
jgi:hypothetical protein